MELRDQLQQTLGESYTLERELGGGGMSRVFVAAERALDRKVVVKVVPPAVAGGVDIERFKREIQVAARLQHAHIVPLLTAGETNGLPYYTMPFVEGESLRARLVRSGALPITETISVLRDVARALAYAHEHGVMHRDIKPDNIMLSGGSAVVTDFGIAKAITVSRTESAAATLTQIGTSLGTPAYMPPSKPRPIQRRIIASTCTHSAAWRTRCSRDSRRSSRKRRNGSSRPTWQRRPIRF